MRRRFSPIRPLIGAWHALTGPTMRAIVKELIVRTYALLILLLVSAAGYWAVRYLVRTVFYPPEVPAQILQWQGRLDAASLRASSSAGVERAAPRSPMGHYHRVDQWFQPDAANGCTIGGCHEPLPHGSKIKVAAFANFHTTFLDCRMCHAPAAHPAAARWISTDTNQPAQTPVILQLMAYLEQNTGAIESNPAAVNPTITALLQQTVITLGGDGTLDQLLAQMQSTQPGSPVWKDAAGELSAELPLHARGEYRAKLDWISDDRAGDFRTLSDQARQFAADPKDENLKHVIHAQLAKEPASCLACHDDKPGMLDFAAAGYSSARAKYLSSLEVARLVQHTREGQPFYLPNVEGAQ